MAMHKILYTLKQFLDDRFHMPVRKLPVHTFLGCPHRNAETGEGGCVYCNESGFSTPDRRERDVRTQIRQGIDRARGRGFKGRFIVYFQTGTNTCAEPDLLESWWRTALEFSGDVAGLSMSTRPDCLSDEDIRILSALGCELTVWVELGLQSASDSTLRRIHRGHVVRDFVDAVGRLRAHPHLLTCAHIILGLPGESEKDMLRTVRLLNGLGVHGVKIHHLQVVKGTVLADWFAQGRVPVMDEDAYIRLLVKLIPEIRPDMVIHRLFGDIHDSLLIAPKWKTPKSRMIQNFRKALEDADLFQGKCVSPQTDDSSRTGSFRKGEQ